VVGTEGVRNIDTREDTRREDVEQKGKRKKEKNKGKKGTKPGVPKSRKWVKKNTQKTPGGDGKCQGGEV